MGQVVAELVKNCNKYCPGAHFVLENPTLEALNAVAYTYFDTRPTPLARVNVFDMNNSPMMRNRILRVRGNSCLVDSCSSCRPGTVS